MFYSQILLWDSNCFHQIECFRGSPDKNEVPLSLRASSHSGRSEVASIEETDWRVKIARGGCLIRIGLRRSPLRIRLTGSALMRSRSGDDGRRARIAIRSSPGQNKVPKANMPAPESKIPKINKPLTIIPNVPARHSRQPARHMRSWYASRHMRSWYAC